MKIPQRWYSCVLCVGVINGYNVIISEFQNIIEYVTADHVALVLFLFNQLLNC